MTGRAKPKPFSIGWDVGGWNCDKNPRSRDAIVILDSMLKIVGEPWRGNLREGVCENSKTSDWLKALFKNCDAEFPDEPMAITMAIDAPLGFSEEFVNLVTSLRCVDSVERFNTNRYLFRQTDRGLFNQGLKPLSPVNDMIGSQATKGMHVLAKFAPIVESCGVWTDGEGFHALETYPTACRETRVVKKLLKGHKPLRDDDRNDARICALVAHLFATDRGAFSQPPESVPQNEGWIWVPRKR